MQSLQAKGGSGLTWRACSILARFGPTSRKMAQYLDAYAQILEEFGARPTLPITAVVLARHTRLIQVYAARGIEFACHGFIHNDHAGLSFEQQRASIGRATDIFRVAGIACVGFRGPYLRYNRATLEAARALGLRYHSSQAVTHPVFPPEVMYGPHCSPYRRIVDYYRAQSSGEVAVRPREQRGLVDVPVSLPDDEIMVDRLRLTKEAQAAAWLNVLGETHARGEVFTLQLHPERIFESLEALRAVLAAARQRQPRVWIARLDEIADWWLRRREARLQVAEVRPERYRVSLSGDADATLLVRDLPAPAATPWFGHDLVAEARDFEVDSPLSPVLGMSTRVPQVVRDFLGEEGFPIQISEDRTRFGVYLGPEDAKLDEVTLLSRIDRARRPLVRLWRWPRAARSALAVTGDIDSITLQDFALRLVETWETPRLARAASPNGASVYPPVSGEVGGLQ